jgi:hypothetical protein
MWRQKVSHDLYSWAIVSMLAQLSVSSHTYSYCRWKYFLDEREKQSVLGPKEKSWKGQMKNSFYGGLILTRQHDKKTTHLMTVAVTLCLRNVC